MAEEEVNEAEGAEEEGEPKKSKGSLKLLGAVVGLLSAGAALATMAMPKKVEVKTLDGPSMHVLFTEGGVTGNPLDDNFARYFKFDPSCSYLAYDLAYPATRAADPHYEALLRESIQHMVSSYRLDELYAGRDNGTFASELEMLVEPILFPVHLGETMTPYDIHEESGLRLGDSQDREGTFRGAFYEYVLHVDAEKKTLKIGEGPEVTFSDGDYNVLVEAEDETKLYIDVSAINEGFAGEVHVGVMGRIRRLFLGEVMAQ